MGFVIEKGILKKYYEESGVNEVVIPDSVTEIDSGAFEDCKSLKSITIPDSVTEIGFRAFCGCKSLTSITIPDSVTEIGFSAFEDCESLTSITIPDSVTKIGWGAFCGTEWYEEQPEGAVYAGKVFYIYKGTCPKSVTIKDGTLGIAGSAFKDCKSLKSITIPDSVTEIGFRAFCGTEWYEEQPEGAVYAGKVFYIYKGTCPKSVTIKDGTLGIAGSAFSGCESLTSIIIPDSVTKIGVSAFYGCKSLTSITIPESVTEIGDCAFSGCKSLTSIMAYLPVTAFPSENKTNTILGFVKMLNEGKSFSEKTLKDNQRYIISRKKRLYPFALEHDELLKYMTENKIIPIDDADELLNEKDINTQTRAMLIEYRESAFTDEQKNDKLDKDLGLRELTAAELKKIWTVKKADDGTYVISKYKGKDAVVSVPKSIGGTVVSKIEEVKFKNCSEITNIIIQDGIKEIGYWAFRYCESLTSIIIPYSVTEIGSSAFEYCKSLTSITIPDSVTEIGRDAFYGTEWYEEQLEGAVYAGKVFYRYKGTCPKSVTIKDGTLGIAGSAFSGCESLTSIIIPDSVTKIGESAFYRCKSLTSIIIPDSVTKIGRDAFYGCESLTSITIPDGVTEIGSEAFYGCKSLTSITIPESVTEIGYKAFYGCKSLTSITIPDSVTEIDSEAFYGTEWYEEQPEGAVYAGKVFYRYKGTCPKSVTIKDGTLGIAGSAFEGCWSLKSITIPDSVTEIGSVAFRYCTGLTSITIPDSVTEIGYGAFRYCTGLTSITIPDSVTEIGSSAFEDCKSLTSITIPESVTEIGSDSFHGCSSLTIRGSAGSYAEKYAKRHKISFVAE